MNAFVHGSTCNRQSRINFHAAQRCHHAIRSVGRHSHPLRLFVCLFVLRQPCMSVPAAAYSPRGHAHEVRVSSPCIARLRAEVYMSAQGVLRGYVGRTALARACSSVHEVRSIDLSCSTPAGVSANARPVCSSESETATVLSIHIKHAASSQLRVLKWTVPEHAAESPLWGALCLLAARAAVSCSSTAAAKSGVHAVLRPSRRWVPPPMSSARVAVQRQMPRHDARALRGRAHACRSRTTTRAAA
jgi:hypothetical protein